MDKLLYVAPPVRVKQAALGAIAVAIAGTPSGGCGLRVRQWLPFPVASQDRRLPAVARPHQELLALLSSRVPVQSWGGRRPCPPRSRHLSVTLLALVSLATGGCSDSAVQATAQPRNEPQAPDSKPVLVAAEPVRRGSIASFYATTATLDAEHQTTVHARVEGIVKAVYREEGDVVKEGDVLAQLEDDDQQLRRKQARLKLKLARSERDRIARMHAASLLPDQDLEQRENELETAAAEVEAAELQLANTRVRAPLGGRVVRRHVDVGGHVSAAAPLFEIMDVEPMLVRIHVPANRLADVAPGQAVELTVGSRSETLTGKVTLVSPVVDPQAGTVKVTAEIHEYPAGVRPGDFAATRVATAVHDTALLVPAIAAFEEQDQQVVFVAASGKAQRRVVITGFSDRGLTEIVSGVSEGELVVVKGQRNLRDGLPITLEASAAAPTVAAPAEPEA
ncbi:MAG: efflux RND transporter periplasmic adaptor subunit [Candidatus Schekmanbacteria bacterium]|nr:efflux RND transporter periplasmic adaptor subunit [Candidatus Schekmanbacteria bacterium]